MRSGTDTRSKCRPGRGAILLWSAVAVQLVLLLVLAHDERFTLARGSPSVLLKLGLLWLPFLGAVLAAWRLEIRVPARLLAVLVLLFHAAALTSEPPTGMVAGGTPDHRVFRGWFSDDFHRFLLDGELWLWGENPYRVVPELVWSEVTEPPDHARYVNHPFVKTFYSPLAEIWFTAVAFSGTSWRGLGIGNALAHAAAVLLLASLLRGRRHRTALLLLFALNPLILVEGSFGLHFDPLVMLALLGLHASLEKKRPTAAAACWAAAVGLKLFPLILVPLVLRRVGWRRMAVAGAALGLLHIPFATRETLEVYRYFASIPVNPSPIAEILPFWVRVVLLLAVIVFTNCRASREGSAILLPILALLFLFSTVHPWYLLWVLPFAMLELRHRWPIVVWSGLIVAAYTILLDYFGSGIWSATTPVTRAVWIGVLWMFTIAFWFRMGHYRRGGVLLLVWPVFALLYLGWRFESGLFGGPWPEAYPYLWWCLDLPVTAPWAMRVLAVWPVRLLTSATGLGPVTVGYLVLGTGHAIAAALLWLMLRSGLTAREAGKRLLLYLSVPVFWLLPFGQVTGGLDGPPEAGWHFSHYTEGVYLPILFLTILLLRRGARDRAVVPLLVLLLLTKESAFFLAGAYWTLHRGFSWKRAALSVAMGAGYLAVLKLSGLSYPPGVPLALPSFTAEHLTENAWKVLIALAWLIPAIALTARRGLQRPEALAILAYAALLLGFAMFWETRLWLAAAPLALCAGAQGPAPSEVRGPVAFSGRRRRGSGSRAPGTGE